MKEFFDRYKVVIFLIYSLAAGLIFALVAPFSWWKLLLFIPLGVLGGYLLWKMFPRSSEEHLTVVRVNGDGSVLITKSAVSRSVADAVKVIKEVKYLGCEVENSRTGINTVIHVKVLEAKVVETSELIKEFVRNLLEEELNVKVNKIDIVVKKVQYSLRVNKIDETGTEIITTDTDEDKKNKTKQAIQKADKNMVVPVSEFNAEYSFAVGNEKKRVVVKGGDEDAKRGKTTDTAKSAKPANLPTPINSNAHAAPVQTAQTKPAAAPIFNSNAKSATPAYPIAPKTIAPTTTATPRTTTIPAPAVSAEHEGPIDLKAELARRKAEREALLNKINTDSNKLN